VPEERIPILLDTDIGTDIDDALCLAYLLQQPRCELIGITTVTGEPDKRAALADALCRAAGKTDIPIHAGVDLPMLSAQRQPLCQQAEALSSVPHREDFRWYTAIEFLRETIRGRPNELTLLAIGPLTNVGLLFAVDPAISKLLKRLVLMCGVFTTQVAGTPTREWNALCDPHATAIVYNAVTQSHLSIGLDVTLRCRMDAQEARRRLRGTPVLEVVGRMAEVWFRSRGQVVFHDPLAAAVIFEPNLCRYQQGRVEVELVSQRLCGTTLWDTGSAEKPHRIALEVDPQRFFERYFSVVGP